MQVSKSICVAMHCRTLLLFYPSIPDYDSWSALLCKCRTNHSHMPATARQHRVLYPNLMMPATSDTIGSCGFLFVDVQEFFTFGGAILRTNIAMSMIGVCLVLALLRLLHEGTSLCNLL
jgi:hypothetical protein